MINLAIDQILAMRKRLKRLALVVLSFLALMHWIADRAFAADLSNVTPFEKEMVDGFERSAARPSSLIDSAYVVRLATINGFQRLDDRTLLQMMHLRAELARSADVATCADLWNGDRYDAVVRAIEASPMEKQRHWAAIFDEAAIATFEQKPVRPAPAPSEVHLAMRRMLQAMPPPDQLAMLDLTADDPRPTFEEQ